MAIRLITGLPGSGKSYYVVKEITSIYCNKFADTYELKSDCVLISNVTNLLLNSYSLEDMIAKAGSVEVFFSSAYQQRVRDRFEGKNLVYVIDEAQKFFHRKFYNRGVFEFFETHRHFGIDIYLVSQNSNLLARDVLALAEIETRAVPRTLAITGFSYQTRSQGEIIARKVLKKDKAIFSLYKSQNAEETQAIRRPYLKLACYFVCFFVFGYLVYSATFAGWMVKADQGKNEIAQTTQITKKVHPNPIEKVSPSQSKIPVSIPTVRKRLSYCRKGSAVYFWSEEANSFVTRAAYPHKIMVDLSGGKMTFYADVPYEGVAPIRTDGSAQRPE